MRRIAALCLAASCMAAVARAGLFGGKWWRELPAGEMIADVTSDLGRAKAHWEIGPGLRVAMGDEFLLNLPVIEHSGGAVGFLRTKRPIEGPCDIVALIRITEEKASHHGATLACGVRGPSTAPEWDFALDAASSPATGRFHLTLSPTMGTVGNRAYQTHRPAIEDPVRTQWPHAVTIAERFSKLPDYWPAPFRAELEAEMAKLAPVHGVWFTLRIELRPDAARLFKDGFLVAERRPPGRVAGDVGIWLRGNVRLASLGIGRPGAEEKGFHTVRLDDACNARGLVRAEALPPRGSTAAIRSVPFAFPAEGGHVDVGASLFRFRRHADYIDALTTWPEPGLIDPARIRFSVPNRPWRRLWLVAAADGEPTKVPIVTARFYRPRAGFAVDAAAEVPTFAGRGGPAHNSPKGTRRLPVTLADGKSGSLWLVPIELDSATIASRFREEHTLSLELTKQVHDWRMHPDPCVYDRFQGGLPSGVRIFAMTLEEAPIRLIASSNRTGNAFVSPETPVWQVKLANLLRRESDIRVRLTITDPYGKATSLESASHLGPGLSGRLDFPLAPQVFGLHRVRTEVEAEGETFVQEGTFVQLPPDTRKADAATSRWGLWWWRGGHLTNPNEAEDLYLLRAAGTRIAAAKDIQTRRQWGMIPNPAHVLGGPAPWAFKDPYDPKEYEKLGDEVGLKVAEMLKESPDIPYFCVFTEQAISEQLTYGILSRFVGEGEQQLTAEEKARLRAFIITGKAACEGIRKHAPKARISLGWCEPIFSVPFMWEKFPKEFMDAIGLDTPQFERMPEMPIRSVAPNRLWMLQQEMKRCGYEGIPIIHTESYFASSHPLALGPRTAADYYVRTSVLSLVLGTARFMWCFTLHDCADYWGSNHYGCIGITGPRPEFNPKPAFPAYATMTRLLDQAQFDGYVPTGSHSAYCVRFRSGSNFIHCLWTIRGQRTAILHVPKAKSLVETDESGNERRVPVAYMPPDEAQQGVTLTPTPIWITTDQPITKIEMWRPQHNEQPGRQSIVLDGLDVPWSYDSTPYDRYAKNHWDLPRFPGPMKSESAWSDERPSPFKTWQITLEDPPKERPLAAWYGVFKPPKPIAIPGKARALGIWANGHSNWGRIIYEIEDAQGEVWQSIGTKNEWNCDDIHSWSYFNFDGRRWLEFPLPNNLPGDNYREKDTVWWNHSAEGIVDLPVKLTRIIIEMRTHNIYVNDLVPVADRRVQLDNLTAVYDNAEAMTDAPVRLQHEAGSRAHGSR